jgi:hypothetical protein
MAPPLAGSPRVQGHRDYTTKVLMRGMVGPIDGKTYRDVMVPMDNTDEWLAGVASYVRTSFGNTGDLVTAADVARVRAEISGRKAPWTVEELERSLPRPLDAQRFKLSASHSNDTAPLASTLRGWVSGTPQIPGMWLQVELPQPALVTEVQFESGITATAGRGGGRGNLTPAPAPGAPPNAVARGAGDGGGSLPTVAGSSPNVGYPRAYSVQVSTDGKKWSKPVAQGMGTGGRTTIGFTPVRAQFVRVTQTDNIAGAPPLSIRNLRVYEAAGK